MDPVISTFLILAVMAAVVFLFRTVVRRPVGVSQHDPPGLRTMVLFSGDDPEFFQEDKEDEPFVGIRLLNIICDGLAAHGIGIENRGVIQNAQRAECVLGMERFALVLEWIDEEWVASIEWVPEAAAEKRHLALTQQVFAPPDSDSLRRLLAALDEWLKADPKISNVRWHRKERWIAEDTSDPSDFPIT